MPVVRDPDAAGIDVERVAEAARPLQVRVPAGQHCRVVTEERLERVTAEFGQENVVVRARRAVEAEKSHAVKFQSDDRPEGANLLELRGAQPRQRPFAHLEEPLRDRFRRVGGHVEQQRVRIAEHRLAAEGGEAVEGLRRLRATLRDIAEADDLLHAEPLDVLEHGTEGDVVRVLIGDERESHGARLPWPRVVSVVRKLVIAVALAAALVFAAASAATGRSRQESVSTSTLMPGVTYSREVDFTSRGPIVLDVVTAAKPTGALYSLAPALSNDQLAGKETLTHLAGRVAAGAAAVAIDGDYFDRKSGAPSGILMQNGVLESAPATGRSSLGIAADGTLTAARVSLAGAWQGNGQRRPLLLNGPVGKGKFTLYTPAYGAATPNESGVVEAVIGQLPPAQPSVPLDGTVMQVTTAGPTRIPPGGAVLVARGSQSTAQLRAEAPVGQHIGALLSLSPNPSGLASAIGGGPALVRNGKPVFHAGESFDPRRVNSRQPRGAIGQLPDGRILLVAVEGTNPAYSIGMSSYELAVELSRLGATTAFGLDAGPAAGIAFNGKLLTRPSGGTEAKLSDALVLSYSGVYAAPPSASVLSPNGDGAGDSETLVFQLARPSDVSATLAGPNNMKVTLATGAESQGVHTLTWDGTNGGTEGQWTFTVTATDDRKVTTTAQRTLLPRRHALVARRHDRQPWFADRDIPADAGRERRRTDRAAERCPGGEPRLGAAGGGAAARDVAWPDRQAPRARRPLPGRGRGDELRGHELARGPLLIPFSRASIDSPDAHCECLVELHLRGGEPRGLRRLRTDGDRRGLPGVQRARDAVRRRGRCRGFLGGARDHAVRLADRLRRGRARRARPCRRARLSRRGSDRLGDRPLRRTRRYSKNGASWFHLSRNRLDRAEAWFDNWGNVGVLIGRVTPVVRSFVSIPAGIFEMPLAPYAVLTLVGSAVWAFAFAGVGYGFGSNYHRFDHGFHYAEYAVVAGIVLGAAYLVYRRMAAARVTPRADDSTR